MAHALRAIRPLSALTVLRQPSVSKAKWKGNGEKKERRYACTRTCWIWEQGKHPQIAKLASSKRGSSRITKAARRKRQQGDHDNTSCAMLHIRLGRAALQSSISAKGQGFRSISEGSCSSHINPRGNMRRYPYKPEAKKKLSHATPTTKALC